MEMDWRELSMEEKGYNYPLELFFPACSFDIKFVSKCQCMHVPLPEQQVASSEGGREAQQRKSDQDLENWGGEKDPLPAWGRRI